MSKLTTLPKAAVRATKALFLGAWLGLLATSAAAQLTVSQAWARATVGGQLGTGAFMTLQAQQPLKLVGVKSSVAGVAELHESSLQNGVMRMRAVTALDLPKDRSVHMRPGGLHLMLMDLSRPLAAGEIIDVDLLLQTANGTTLTYPVKVEVRAAHAAPPAHP